MPKPADLVIAKPGGLICAEATALGKPVLFINEGYGQEKGNADYLINNEAAILAKGFDRIENLVNIIFNDNNLNRMSENSKRIGKRNASETILNKVIKLINT